MSTEHQRYSLENQAAAIAEYAAERGYEVVATYADPGRSGLTLAGRPGLARLLADALAPGRGFEAILVLDVSRWGRFQDPDQAAHYEFICRSAGVPVVFCGEAFDNDGSPSAAIVKHLKRLMAGEYSRELSVRIHRAQLRQATLGYKQGGPCAYGVRRAVVSTDGRVLRTLEDGQYKALNEERVVLVWGPSAEIEVIRRIFRLFTREGLSIQQIADRLNDEKILATRGQAWSYWRVRTVLVSELARGVYVFNRLTRRMKSPARQNPTAAWIRIQMIPPIVTRRAFEAAQRKLVDERGLVFSDAELLRRLQLLLDREGRLSDALIDAAPDLPHSATYRKRFGGLRRAYALVGYAPRRRWRGVAGKPASDEELLRRLRELHARAGYVTAKLIAAARETPCAEVYVGRFGSLREAYRRAGLPHDRFALLSQGHLRSKAPCGPSRDDLGAADISVADRGRDPEPDPSFQAPPGG